MKTGRGYAIANGEKVYNWAEPTRQHITEGEWAPGPGEKIVRVRIITESEYRKLVKNQKP
jgi:hypothetical protein